MINLERCPECRVPKQMVQNRNWLNSGVIVQSTNPTRRTGILESENLDPLYAGIGELVGVALDKIIIGCTHKWGITWMRGMLTADILSALRDGSLELRPVIDFLTQIDTRASGFGKTELLELAIDPTEYPDISGDSHVRFRVTEPYSILPICGMYMAGFEVIAGARAQIEYDKISDDIYEIDISVGEHRDESDEHFQAGSYCHRDGDLELPRCETCGGPKALSAFRWYDDRGVIINTYTGKRMTGVGPYVMDPLFHELENELGDEIPAAVVESQRRFVKTGFFSVEDIANEGNLRSQLALRGLGNLRAMKMAPKGFSMKVENAGCYLMQVGMVQAIFEMAFGVDSWAEWEFSKEGDLQAEIMPRK